MPTVRWQRHVPEAIRRLDTLVDPDYTDLFTAAPIHVTAKSPEGWARAIFDGAPAALRLLIPVVHRWLLGLRLGPRSSPAHILGWKISDRGEDYVTLEVACWFMTPHLLLKTEDNQISVATLICYDRSAARCIWPPVSIVHRHVGIALLRHALRSHQAAGR
jgi:hypothetical protein